MHERLTHLHLKAFASSFNKNTSRPTLSPLKTLIKYTHSTEDKERCKSRKIKQKSTASIY